MKKLNGIFKLPVVALCLSCLFLGCGLERKAGIMVSEEEGKKIRDEARRKYQGIVDERLLEDIYRFDMFYRKSK